MASIHKQRCFYIALVLAVASLPQTSAHAEVNALPATIGSMVAVENAVNLREQPLSLLAKFPNAGAAMAHFVAKAITAEPALVDPVISIINDTSPAQASAIGAGFVRAVRAIGAKQPGLYQSIAEKVMRSDNTWLKTTFSAIGPRAGMIGGGKLPPMLPPTIAADLEGGSPLSKTKARIGQTDRTYAQRINPRITIENNFVTSEVSEIVLESGIIVATVNSDAPSNGAVSTSPTF